MTLSRVALFTAAQQTHFFKVFIGRHELVAILGLGVFAFLITATLLEVAVVDREM